MFLVRDISQEELSDVRSFIGAFEENLMVEDVKFLHLKGKGKLHDWSYIGIKFHADATEEDKIKFLVNCQGDDFVGIHNDLYVLWFD
jgi:hypothetical protein